MNLEKDLNITNICLIILGVWFLFWLIKYNWSRRWLYYYGSKIDGPFAFPMIGSFYHFYIHRKELGKWLMKVFRKYDGSIFKFWIGPKLFVFVTRPKHAEVVLKSCLAKSDLYDYITPIVRRGLLTAEVEKWKQHKKLINLTFNQKILDSYVDTFVKHANVLVENLKTTAGEIDVHPYFLKCTSSSVSVSLLGLDEAENVDNYHALLKRVEELMYVRFTNILHHIEIYWKFTSACKKLNYFCKKAWDFTSKIIERKREENLKDTNMKNCKKSNFLKHLIEITDNEGKWTQEELMEETQTMIITGTNSTINSECFVMLMLAMHPDIQQKVYEEISKIMGKSDRDIDVKDLDQLTYLECVIKETLRLFPIGMVIGRSIDRNLALDSYIIPKGSTVLIPIMYMQRNSKIWPDPLKFNPDRFLPEEINKQEQYAFMSFSVPPRNCIGLKYAMMNMKATIATVLRHFELNSSQFQSVKDIKLELSFALISLHGFKMTLKLR